MGYLPIDFQSLMYMLFIMMFMMMIMMMMREMTSAFR
jgi:hypothetical protein